MDGTLSGMRLSAVAIGGTVVAGLLGPILSPVVGELGAIGLIAGALMLAAWYGNLASAVGSAVIGVAATAYVLRVASPAADMGDFRFLPLGIFVLLAGVIVWVAEQSRRSIGAARASEARLAGILHVAEDAIVSVDESQHITLFNQGAEVMFGYTAREVLGERLDVLIPARFAERHSHHVREFGVAPETGRWMGDRARVFGRRRDGTEFPAEATISKWGHGGNMTFTAILRDTSEESRRARERAELLIREQFALQEARAAARAREQLLAAVSHELRTPLTAILAWAAVLRSSSLDQTTRDRALVTIERSANLLTILVDDLLEFSRMATGKFALRIQPGIDLRRVVDAAVEGAHPAALAKQIALQTILDPAVPPVTGDPQRLLQVIWNLVSNAIKFTGPGGNVRVRLTCGKREVQIAVTDTGRGIPVEHLPHVFDPFWQADPESARGHGGLGLGLAIVRQIVHEHKGEVVAESGGKGKGATFTVRIPVPDRGSQAGAPTSHLSAPTLTGVAILYVERQPEVREALTTVLAMSGARVSVVVSTAEALASLRKHRPDILIAEIGPPGDDAFALIRTVRALPAEEGGRIPAVALTAYAGSEDRARILSSGFQVHFTNPVDPAELTDAVALVVGELPRNRPL